MREPGVLLQHFVLEPPLPTPLILPTSSAPPSTLTPNLYLSSGFLASFAYAAVVSDLANPSTAPHVSNPATPLDAEPLSHLSVPAPSTAAVGACGSRK